MPTNLTNEERKQITQTHTQGRCWRCQIIWYWPRGKRRLYQTVCPKCFGKLIPTTWQCRSVDWRPLQEE